MRAKIQYLLSLSDTEISFFGVSTEDNPLAIVDVFLPKQECSSMSTKMDDDSIAEWMDDMFDAGYHPDRYSSVWIHTHPGGSPNPSGTDEDTFSSIFGRKSFAIMYILAREGRDYCRIQWNQQTAAGKIGSDEEIKSIIDWTLDFPASNQEQWDEEFKRVTEWEPYIIQSGCQPWNTMVGMPRTPSHVQPQHNSYNEWWKEKALQRAAMLSELDDATIAIEDDEPEIPERLKAQAEALSIYDVYDWCGALVYTSEDGDEYVEKDGKLVLLPCDTDEALELIGDCDD